eukprot:CAMPEP_0117011608 /NCGR_PEP_ID=MMETSP0472-20121206/9950_1 /TAXON_ID=693140 ORGANISM="Tiarina fusus, Strain LIS" /NCGR_SAMPLE_ID=MMETSP0472 /ASSEMBLY_ACC=CAM_ASM_000603 /LENGTH=272 /DNA_ID=CAMNT_0004714471 /DNA_START=15 /DNA_END=836 /DNA_ORIENTATION=-
MADLQKGNPINVSDTLNEYKKQFLPTTVDKTDDLFYDLGNLFCLDSHPLDLEKLAAGNPEEYLHDVSRDNVQLLFNQIFSLPTERETNGVFATLPSTITKIPREKPIPKPKQDTAWEKYAKIKGIVKKKRGKMIFDEQTKEWKPRWGYKRGNTDLNDWLIEHKPSETGDFEDPFLKRKADKRDRISSQTKREGKNKHRANKQGASQYEKFLSGGLSEGSQRRLATKDLIQEDLNKTRTATASMGKFDRKLQNEKKNEQRKATKTSSCDKTRH